MYELDCNIGKEIFLVTDCEEESSEFHVSKTWSGLINHLKTLTPNDDTGIKVFHGILTTGEFLPSSFYGKSAYVICLDPTDEERITIVESGGTCPEELSTELESVLGDGGPSYSREFDIEHIYILYGYQIEVCLCIDEDDIDEEIIETCKQIAEEAENAGMMSRRRRLHA